MGASPQELPSGTVTFVFTDIEGSTRMFRALGDSYPPLLERHRAILREAWLAHGGHEMQTEGDSFFVAFADQRDAILACADGQRALAAEPWPPGASDKVRMGVHTGVAVPRGTDYVSFAVHQAARVVDAGHGGQVLVSSAAASGVGSLAPFSLRSLGSFRVRDFDDAVELWQVVGPGIDGSFPALRVLPADHHNLAVPLTTLLGRVGELEHLAQVVAPSKAVTLVGPGGVGKTRLAIEHGLRSLERWPDGVWFVDLATLDDGGLVAAAVAAALGLRTTPGADALTDVLTRLAERTTLLILDNVEQVREATTRLVAAILQRCPGVGVVATSREPLGWRAETVLRLGPLAWSGGGGTQPAVQLFLDRASEAGALDTGPRAPIEELCRRLDGLPLAIEMAAARTAVLTPEEILAGLDDAARGFVSRDPTLSPRHRSLDDLLAWSDRMLDDHERAALRRLAVFAGAFGYETAAAAVAEEDADLVPEIIWSLANKSLLNADATAGGTRYRFPETVRTFARRHDPLHEATAAGRRLAAWYLDRIGPTCALDRAWVARMGEELDNVRGLLAIVAADDPEAAQRLAWSLGQHHDLVQGYRRGIDEIARHAVNLDAPTPSRVGLLTLLADLRLRIGDLDQASSTLAAARALQREVGPAPWDDVAVERTEGELALRLGDAARAARLAEEVLARRVSDRGQGRMWNLLGIARASMGDLGGAAAAFEFELAAWGRLGLEALQVSAHGNVAEALLQFGDRTGAARHQRQSMQLALQYGQPLMVVFSLMVAARLAAEGGQWEMAVRLQTVADAQLPEIGNVMYSSDRAAADAVLAAGLAHLGREAFDDAQRRARTDEFDTFLNQADALFATVGRDRVETAHV